LASFKALQFFKGCDILWNKTKSLVIQYSFEQIIQQYNSFKTILFGSAVLQEKLLENKETNIFHL